MIKNEGSRSDYWKIKIMREQTRKILVLFGFSKMEITKIMGEEK